MISFSNALKFNYKMTYSNYACKDNLQILCVRRFFSLGVYHTFVAIILYLFGDISGREMTLDCKF